MKLFHVNPLTRANLPHWITLLLTLTLIPVLRSLHLPVKFDWAPLLISYWLVLTAQAIFLAAVLAVIGMPRERTLEPFLRRHRENPARTVMLLIFFLVLVWTTSWIRAVVLTIDTAALLEIFHREKAHRLRIATAILAPAAYLFFGFLLVLAYNTAIVSVRFNFATDPALAAMDRWLLHGHSVSELAHWGVRTFPLSFYRTLEFIYFGMFPQIGVTLILLALYNGRAQALRFAGTILMAYYIALAIFYIWPSQGPHYLCPGHFSRFPASLQCYNVQRSIVRHALALWQHQPIARISTDYFIGMPCMHIAQPLIVLWFLRRWKRIVIVLAAYDCLLAAAILMLEQHYVVDLIAAVPVAALAIALSGALHDGDETVARK